MSDDATTYQRLAAPFSLDEHAKVPKGGMNQTYAPWTSYVERMNAELPNRWSFRVIREGFTETECWVLGEVTAIIDGEVVTRQQYGSEPIAKGKGTTTDLLKTTASDALKKAISLFGPGLYLSVKEEREKIDAAMQEAIRAAAAEKRNADRPKPAPQPSKQDKAAVVTGADPTILKTKLELIADLQRGLEFARSLGLDPDDVDGAKLNRAQLEDTIATLRAMCRDVIAERKKLEAS